jgi:ABC-2 type transport system ATP-binding protein
MDHGRILALDTPNALKATLGADSIVTAKADGDAAAFAALLEREIAGATRVRQIDGSVELHIRGTAGVLPRVLGVAEKGGFDLVDLSLAVPTLEDVFINLTGKDLRD